jgi:integrase
LFLLWAINPSAWSSREPPSTPAARQVRADRRTELEAFFADATSPEPRSVSFKPLTSEELVAVERAIGPDARGVYPSVFRRELAERNWLLYEVHRWGGLRRGEVLTLFVIDLPSAASASNVIQVVRRPDDPAEVRGRYAPNVKREGRGVPLPGTLVDELRRYGSAGRRGTTTPYLFVADSGRPLSVARAHRVVKQIGEAAASRFEAAHPGVPHTLRQLSWHRLRHTRAEELLDEFLPESPAAPVPGGESAFLDLFGWATRDSATPYIRRRLGQRADRRLAARDAELTHRYHPEATQ